MTGQSKMVSNVSSIGQLTLLPWNIADLMKRPRRHFKLWPDNTIFNEGLSNSSKKEIEKIYFNQNPVKVNTIFTKKEVDEWFEKKHIYYSLYFLHLMIHEKPLAYTLQFLDDKMICQPFTPYFWTSLKSFIIRGSK